MFMILTVLVLLGIGLYYLRSNWIIIEMLLAKDSLDVEIAAEKLRLKILEEQKNKFVMGDKHEGFGRSEDK